MILTTCRISAYISFPLSRHFSHESLLILPSVHSGHLIPSLYHTHSFMICLRKMIRFLFHSPSMWLWSSPSLYHISLLQNLLAPFTMWKCIWTNNIESEWIWPSTEIYFNYYKREKILFCSTPCFFFFFFFLFRGGGASFDFLYFPLIPFALEADAKEMQNWVSGEGKFWGEFEVYIGIDPICWIKEISSKM